MTVTNENSDEYFDIIRYCKYQVTFPFINADALYVFCTHGVNLNDTPVQFCDECIGKGCKNYKARK